MANITRIILGDKVLAELLANKTVEILGKDRKFGNNVIITFGEPGSIEYDSLTTTVQQGQTATLECKGLIFRSNVIVKTFGGSVEPDEPEEPTIVQLEAPVVYIYDDEEGPEEPEEPDTPPEPIQLDTPFIYLEDTEEDEPTEGDPTFGILGTGRLGQMILGKEEEPIMVAYRLVPNDYGNTLILNVYTTEVTDDGTTVIVG